jgi:phosphoglycerol transferase MdoB-like AlkP superfamily enzyme
MGKGRPETTKPMPASRSEVARLRSWSRARLVQLAGHSAGWALALFGLFFVLKVAATLWFLAHDVDPFSDFARWKIPLLLATDLSAAGVLSVLLGLLGTVEALPHKSARVVAALVRWLLVLSVVAIAAVNLRIIEAYRAVLDRYLLRKVGDPSVMSESIVANMDSSFLLALGFGIAILALLPRWLRKRTVVWNPNQAYGFLGSLVVLSVVPLFGAHEALSGRETFGLKHNAILALAAPPPGVFQYADPHEVHSRLKPKLPRGPELSALAATSSGPTVPGRPELHGHAKDYNVLLLLLESVSAGYLDATTMPTLAALQRRSLSYANHRTTAVNTFDSHYSLFRSTPVRGDAFMMRRLHGGFSRDVSIMEVLKGHGYAVGMFHASFLNFIDTRWVWEAPGIDKLVDAQQVISADRPGWSWGANDADVADDALAWARSLGGKKFFLVYNPAGSHHPYLAPRDAVPFPGGGCQPRYKSALFAVDQAIAKLMNGLRDAGLGDKTIVIVVSDHGELIDAKANVCGHGMAMVEDELRVPFFIHHPDVTLSPATELLETSHWDVAPTMAALVGATAAPSWLGRDLTAAHVTPRPTFVGLDYRKHVAIVAHGAVGDLDVINDRVRWSGQPPREATRSYEDLLRSFDARVLLQHASRAREAR